MAWARNGTPSTLTGTADIITISNLTARKTNVFLSHIFASGGAVDIDENFNNDTNNVYNTRKSSNGGAEATGQDTKIDKGTTSTSIFDVNYVYSTSSQEKLVIGFLVDSSTAGAANTPNRIEYTSKYVPSPDANITRVDDYNTGTTNAYAIGSDLTALGTD